MGGFIAIEIQTDKPYVFMNRTLHGGNCDERRNALLVACGQKHAAVFKDNGKAGEYVSVVILYCGHLLPQGEDGPPGPRGPPGERVSLLFIHSFFLPILTFLVVPIIHRIHCV